jgi:hypothetical protein
MKPIGIVICNRSFKSKHFKLSRELDQLIKEYFLLFIDEIMLYDLVDFLAGSEYWGQI